MKQAYREIQGKRSRKIRFALLTTIMMAMLVLQACGNNTGGNGASASGGSNTEKAGEEATSDVPAVLNFGFIGSNKLNVPGGAGVGAFIKGLFKKS